MEREALKLALEALENPWNAGPDGIADAITAIKEVLAQPAQETDILTIAYQSGYYDGKKAAQRPWVGLTDEEAAWCQSPTVTETWKRIEAKLKEKNG